MPSAYESEEENKEKYSKDQRVVVGVAPINRICDWKTKLRLKRKAERSDYHHFRI